jgi:hypothetical protein
MRGEVVISGPHSLGLGVGFNSDLDPDDVVAMDEVFHIIIP